MRRFQLRDDSGVFAVIEAEDMESAIEEAKERAKDGSWDCKMILDVSVVEVDEDDDQIGDVEWIQVEVGEDEPEPPCLDGENHDWQSPTWLGGLKENPGVWSSNGRISSKRVCKRCGAYMIYRQGSLSGSCPKEPDRTTYQDADETSTQWTLDE